LWEISPQTNFIGAFGFGVLGTISFMLWGGDEGDGTPGADDPRRGCEMRLGPTVS
jgi:hypothetical protein